MSEKADRVTGVLSQRPSPNHGTSDVLAEKIPGEGVSGQLLGTARVAAGQCVLQILPRNLHTSDHFARSRKGMKGKKTCTFDAGDIVPGMCVYPKHTNAVLQANNLTQTQVMGLPGRGSSALPAMLPSLRIIYLK